MFRSRGLTCVCRGTFATDCICHRCTVGQRAESERFCSQELFYIVLPDCSLPTNYKRMLRKRVLQKPIVSESFHKVLWKRIVITIRRRGGEAQVCCLPISVDFKKTVADT